MYSNTEQLNSVIISVYFTKGIKGSDRLKTCFLKQVEEIKMKSENRGFQFVH